MCARSSAYSVRNVSILIRALPDLYCYVLSHCWCIAVQVLTLCKCRFVDSAGRLTVFCVLSASDLLHELYVALGDSLTTWWSARFITTRCLYRKTGYALSVLWMVVFLYPRFWTPCSDKTPAMYHAWVYVLRQVYVQVFAIIAGQLSIAAIGFCTFVVFTIHGEP